MEVHTFFLYLLIILLTARVFGEVADRCHTPRVIGELLAGVFLGPSVLGWIEPLTVIKLLAEIGIILLLFEVGLGTDVKRLVRTGGESFWVAGAGFVLPFVLGFSLGYWAFKFSLLVLLFIWGDTDRDQYRYHGTGPHGSETPSSEGGANYSGGSGVGRRVWRSPPISPV